MIHIFNIVTLTIIVLCSWLMLLFFDRLNRLQRPRDQLLRLRDFSSVRRKHSIADRGLTGGFMGYDLDGVLFLLLLFCFGDLASLSCQLSCYLCLLETIVAIS